MSLCSPDKRHISHLVNKCSNISLIWTKNNQYPIYWFASKYSRSVILTHAVYSQWRKLWMVLKAHTLFYSQIWSVENSLLLHESDAKYIRLENPALGCIILQLCYLYWKHSGQFVYIQTVNKSYTNMKQCFSYKVLLKLRSIYYFLFGGGVLSS